MPQSRKPTLRLHAAAGSQQRDNIVRLSPAAWCVAVRQVDEVEGGVRRQLANNCSLGPAAWQHELTEGCPMCLLSLPLVMGSSPGHIHLAEAYCHLHKLA